MERRHIIILTTAGTSLLAILLLAWWILSPDSFQFSRRVPDKDDLSRIAVIEHVNIEGKFQKFSGIPSRIPGSWPNFRGRDHDNISKERVRLADKWPESGPPVLWSLDLGEGYAGPAVHNGRVYILDYDEEKWADSLRCFSLDNGKEIWRRSYKVRVKRNHGRSRTVPAVTDKYVVTIGPKCHVMCVNAVTGAFIWGMDLAKDYGTKIPMWYAGQCPLIDGSIAVIAPGGKYLLMGVDCATGRIKWQTPNPDNWQMSHSSVMPMKFYGKKFYVYCSIGGIVGVSADGKDRGKVLFKTDKWAHSVMSPSPVQLPGSRIFITAGYGVGSMMLKVEKTGEKFSINSLYTLTKEVFACEQQTPIYYKGHLFSILPKDGGTLKQQAACLHPSGHLTWSSSKANRFGLGPFLIADNKLFILDDKGVLTLARASARAYIKLAEAKIFDGRDSWGPMALVKGRLLLRESKKFVCLDVRK